MRMITEQETKFEVDTDWVMPPVADLVPEGGRLDQDVRKLRQHLFRHARCWSTAVWDHAATSDRRLRDGLAAEGSQAGRHGRSCRAARMRRHCRPR